MAACTMRFNLFSNLRYVTATECEISVELSEMSRIVHLLQCPVHPARHACVVSSFSRRRNVSSRVASEIVTADPKSFPIRKNGAVRQTCARARSRGTLMERSAVGDRLFQHSSVDGWLGRRIKVAAVRKSTVTGKTMTGFLTRLQRITNTNGPLSCTNLPV